MGIGGREGCSCYCYCSSCWRASLIAQSRCCLVWMCIVLALDPSGQRCSTSVAGAETSQPAAGEQNSTGSTARYGVHLKSLHLDRRQQHVKQIHALKGPPTYIILHRQSLPCTSRLRTNAVQCNPQGRPTCNAGSRCVAACCSRTQQLPGAPLLQQVLHSLPSMSASFVAVAIATSLSGSGMPTAFTRNLRRVVRRASWPADRSAEPHRGMT